MVTRYLIILLSLLLQATSCKTSTAESPETMVYITDSGTKYHVETCSSLRKSKTAISLAEAVEKGYEPCARCHPPVLK